MLFSSKNEIMFSIFDISHLIFLILSPYKFCKEENSEDLMSKLIILQLNLVIKR